MLPRLVKMGKLTEAWFVNNSRRRKIYSVPRINRKRVSGQEYYPRFEHGLGCTEGLVRFYRADTDCMVIPERKLRGWYIFPEWAIKYFKTGTLLMYEFCTEDNWKRKSVIRSKIKRYKDTFHKFKKKFDAKRCIVVFVADANRWDVDGFVKSEMPTGSEFYFTDYTTFCNTPIGEQLSTPIYIWGNDRWSYPLREQYV